MSLDMEQLYQAHSASLMKYALRMTGDADLAADLVQDTFLRCAEHQPRIDYVREWLFKVATNLIRETGRKHYRRLRLMSSAPYRVPAPEPPPTPDDEYRRTVARSSVRTALLTLAPRDRTALLMREEGFSHREIAEVLGIGTSSVGKTIMRAMQRFSREMTRTLEER